MMKLFKFLHLGALMILGTQILMVEAQAWATTSWTDAHATFYGGQDASGTMGGSCGYGNLYNTGYGVSTTALSVAMFNNGLSCGACFNIICQTSQTSYCYEGPSIIVTATNECPNGSNGGWCDYPKLHFDLAYPMFTTLAQEVGGVIPISFQRVPCQKSGGVRFQLNGNPYFLLVLATNVAGGGDISSLRVKGDNTDWYYMSQNWGVNWECNGQPAFVGQRLSFQATLGNGATQDFYDVASPNWYFSQTFEASSNFY